MIVPVFVVLGVLAMLPNVAQIYFLEIHRTEGPNAYGSDPRDATA